jgi:hypothetical protein
MEFVYTLLSSRPLPPFITNQMPPLKHRSDVSVPAENIYHLIHYFLNESLSLDQLLAKFPLKVAIEELGDYPECTTELEWEEHDGEDCGEWIGIMGHPDKPIEKRSIIL